MSEKKQSSIDWLIEQLKKRGYAEDFSTHLLFKQAKEMHRIEIEEAYDDGWHENNHEKYNPKQYYNETFNK